MEQTEIGQTLRTAGLKSTPARRAVLHALGSTTNHLSADDLAAQVAAEHPDVHRATVFRTLERLVAVGVVSHVHLPHGATTYHIRQHDERMHLHLLCRGCHEVFDVAADLLDEVVGAANEEIGFIIEPEHSAMSGWCRDCAPAGVPRR